MTSDRNDHTDAEFARRQHLAEMAEDNEGDRRWNRYCSDVEAALGIRSLDGDEAADGYSLDSAYDAFASGLVSAREYALGRRWIPGPFGFGGVKFTPYATSGGQGWAGPFSDKGTAEVALWRVQAAGCSAARIAAHSSQVMTSDNSPIILNCTASAFYS